MYHADTLSQAYILSSENNEGGMESVNIWTQSNFCLFGKNVSNTNPET